MQGSAISKLIVTGLIAMVSIFLAVDVMASGGNALGKIYSYVMIGSAIFGLLSPRAALIYLFILTAYLDTFKRFMILDSGVSMKDLYYVLGIAPATMFGILLSLLNAAIQGRIPLAKGQGMWIVGIFTAQAAMMGLSLLAVGRSSRAVGDAVNLAAYIGLLIVVPLVYRSRAELAGFLKTVLLILVPSAFYIIYQSYAGINALEMDYLKSGLTIEIKQLYEVKFRPFGTMNSASSAAIVFGVLSVAALTGPWGKRLGRQGGDRVLVGFGVHKFALFLLFAFACYVTQGRTGWITALLGWMVGYIFKSRLLTLLTYFVSLSGGLALIFGSTWLLKNEWLSRIDKFVLRFSDSAVMDRQLTVGSFYDRLSSFDSLISDSRLWTPFGWKLAGIPESKKPLIHDAITDMLVRFGYIPWSILIVVVFLGILKMHRIVLSQTDPADKSLAACCAACVFVLGIGCLSSWSQLFAFPINVYVWTFPAILAGIHFSEKTPPAPPLIEKGAPVERFRARSNARLAVNQNLSTAGTAGSGLPPAANLRNRFPMKVKHE